MVEEDYREWYGTIPGCEDTEIHLVQPMSVPVCYESVTCFLGFHQEDVGKTMGLSCYGKPNDEIPSFIHKDNEWKDTSDVVAKYFIEYGSLPSIEKSMIKKIKFISTKSDIAYSNTKRFRRESHLCRREGNENE